MEKARTNRGKRGSQGSQRRIANDEEIDHRDPGRKMVRDQQRADQCMERSLSRRGYRSGTQGSLSLVFIESSGSAKTKGSGISEHVVPKESGQSLDKVNSDKDRSYMATVRLLRETKQRFREWLPPLPRTRG